MKTLYHLLFKFLLCWHLLLLLCYFILAVSGDETSFGGRKCISTERKALLQFKQGIQSDNCGLLSSWGEQEDCCQWNGVRCSNLTGHVITLHLPGSEHIACLEGKVDFSLFELEHLKYLDLSFNGFSQTIPKTIDSLTNLKHLDLSKAGFMGEIPVQLGNLSRLAYLDLSSYDYFVSDRLTATSLQWLSRLTMLREVHLSGSGLSEATNWFETVHKLPSLRVLYLDRCELPPIVPSSLSYINVSTSLRVVSLSYSVFEDDSVFQWLFNLSTINNNHFEYLDLSSNALRGPFPSAFGDMHYLSHLDLSSNSLLGPLPSAIRSMHSLSYLSLSDNELEGPILDYFSNLTFLRVLSLSNNALQGPISKSLDNLCSLQKLYLQFNSFADDLSDVIQTLSIGCAKKSTVKYLDLRANQLWGSIPNMINTFSLIRELRLDGNKLNGTISEGVGQLSLLVILGISSNPLKATLNHNHFLHLSELRELYLHNSALVLNISANWISPFQLNILSLRSCNLGPGFPNWISTQTNVSYLDISDSQISGSIPAAFWTKLSANIQYLNVSHNKIHGVLPNLSTTFDSLVEIDLSSNYFEGSIPSFLGANATQYLYLRENMFSDATHILCPIHQIMLKGLYLSNNLLSGELPDCWMKFDQLESLHLENNKFSGNIPTSIGALHQLQYLILRNNSLSGKLPMSLENCTYLVILDLGYNSLTGYIPSNFGALGILNLRENKFHGRLPLSLCQLSNLQILDIASNHISGTIPECIHKLTTMVDGSSYLTSMDVDDPKVGEVDYTIPYGESAVIEWKREEQRFDKAVDLYILIDLSRNQLEGKIPDGITTLKGLISVDLSRNRLFGSIPSNISQLASLEFLDLSNNHLSGAIPISLTQISFLGTLNLSNNKLSGKIPQGTQLQSFDPSSYMGNPLLCGAPLRECPGDKPHVKKPNRENIIKQDEHEHGNGNFHLGLYISVVLGFIIGFWGVCGSLVLKRSWRHAFFQFFDDMKDKLYVMVVTKVARAWRKP